MEIDRDILRKRADGIGATANRDSSVLFYRGFTPISEEVGTAFKSKIPRIGNYPRYASLQVTLDCNLACFGCNIKKIREVQRGREMNLEEIYLVEDRLSERGVQWIDLTGGDPLRRQDLTQIIAHSRELGMNTTLNTNGRVSKDNIKKEQLKWRERAEAGLKAAILSYDGTGMKTDAQVIEMAAFILNTLHVYSAIRTVVTQDNLDKVYNIGEACMSNNVFFEPVPAVALGGEISALPNKNFHPLDAKGRNEYINIIRKLRRVRRPFANFLRIEKDYLKEVVKPDSEWHCTEPARYLLFVNAYGELQVCNDRILQGETYSLLGDTNPLAGNDFYKTVKMQAKECGGCRWLCNWRSQRWQAIETSVAITAAAFS